MSECPICLEEFKHDDALSNTECGHTFHSKCIFRAVTLNINCPSCRTPLVQNTSETENVSQGPQEQTLDDSHPLDDYVGGLARLVNDRLGLNNTPATHTEVNDEEYNLNLPNFHQGLLNRMFGGLTYSNPIDLTNNIEEISRSVTLQEVINRPPLIRPDVEEPSIESVMNHLSSDVEQLSREIVSLNRHPFSNRFRNNEIQHEFRFNRSLRQYLGNL